MRQKDVIVLRVLINGQKVERALFKWPESSFSKELRALLPRNSQDAEYMQRLKQAMAALDKAAKIMEREEVETAEDFVNAWDYRNRPEPDLKRLLNEYVEALEASPTTKRIYRGRAKTIVKVLGEVFVSDIDLKHLEAIDEHFKEKKKTQASAKLCHALLSGLLKWAGKRGIKTKSPYAFFKCSIKKQAEKRHFVSKEEVERLWAFYEKEEEGLSKQAMKLYLLQCYTGARYSDAVNISLSDFEKGFYISQKTGKKTALYMSRRLQLLCPAEKIGLTYGSYRKQLLYISQRIGFDYTKTHAARRYFATEIFSKSDFNLKVVQQALGHSSILTTEKYIGADNKALQVAVMSLGE